MRVELLIGVAVASDLVARAKNTKWCSRFLFELFSLLLAWLPGPFACVHDPVCDAGSNTSFLLSLCKATRAACACNLLACAHPVHDCSSWAQGVSMLADRRRLSKLLEFLELVCPRDRMDCPFPPSLPSALQRGVQGSIPGDAPNMSGFRFGLRRLQGFH